MCGITGYISTKITQQELKASVQSIAHRGPDNQSLWVEGNSGLGHARLSIFDLSAQANQPMISHDGRYVIVYNGEVYNFKQLAEKYNIYTKTTSDTEVILELFSLIGHRFVNEMNGMFAGAIFDKQEQKLFLFRDRMGIKPLYYFFSGEDFAFASEIKALVRFEVIKNNLIHNKDSISQFLHLGYIPNPNTFFENIYKFPSGSIGIFSENKLDIQSYWQVEQKILYNSDSDVSVTKKQLEKLLISSVTKRLNSDVPLGTFLSGGIDSSLVTAIAQKIASSNVKTFSIGFKESKFNEAEYANTVAAKLGTDHHEFMVSETDVLELVDDYFNAYDEPFADSSGFPTMLVSKLAKKYVSVILSGDGGDELFHGYGMYNWANRINNPAFRIFGKSAELGLSLFFEKYKRYKRYFESVGKDHLKSHIFSQEQGFFSEKELEKLLVKYQDSHFDENILCKRKLSPVEEQAIFDLKFYLQDDLLTKVDRASMHYSLEVRVPLLDHSIVEFALNLNPVLKMNGKEQKYLLKQVLFDYLPKEMFDRPKWGFSIPLEKWLKTDLRYLLEKYTHKDIIEKYNIVNFEYVKTLKERYLNGQTFLFNRLWVILILHHRLENF